MSNFFAKPFFDNPFYNDAFFQNPFFKLPFFTGIGGKQIIPDTNFDDDSKWTKTPTDSWIIANNKATCVKHGAVYCDGLTVLGKSYDITITIDEGAVFRGVGLALRASYSQELYFTKAGTYRYQMTAESSNTFVIIDSVDYDGTDATFEGNVSYLSIIES
jgi:hypothetical protein